MKTLAIILAVVVVAGAGAVGGYDYATNGNLGLLPASWTNCDACCTECCPSCPLCDSAAQSTSVQVSEAQSTEECTECASCCSGSKAKTVKAETGTPSQPVAAEK